MRKFRRKHDAMLEIVDEMRKGEERKGGKSHATVEVVEVALHV